MVPQPLHVIRLMMRPARAPDNGEESGLGDHSHSTSASRNVSGSSDSMEWTGDADRDWQCARQILRKLGTDGRRIAMWRQWLVPPTSVRSRAMSDEQDEISKLSSSEKSPTPPSVPVSDYAKSMLNSHVSHTCMIDVTTDSKRLLSDL